MVFLEILLSAYMAGFPRAGHIHSWELLAIVLIIEVSYLNILFYLHTLLLTCMLVLFRWVWLLAVILFRYIGVAQSISHLSYNNKQIQGHLIITKINHKIYISFGGGKF